MNNNVYWNEKEKRALVAKQHTAEMEEKFSDEIKAATKNTVVYRKIENIYDNNKNNNIFVVNKDSVSSIFDEGEGKTAVLNFASYKKPGGMFIEGSKAQEECLCHESFLYNVLTNFTEYYEENNKHLNMALYTNAALYSPDIRFFKNDTSKLCDVITCAAPNFSAAKTYCNISEKVNSKALESRINFVLNIAKENNADTLILGAWGCGVFGQNPEEVATLFKSGLNTIRFNKVVFAIPDDFHSENLKAFQKIFG